MTQSQSDQTMLNRRQRLLLRELWAAGRLSRWELHERTGLTPNAVGAVAADLLKARVVRECPAEPSTGGRPRVPLEIDPNGREVIGISILPGQVAAARLGLSGNRLGDVVVRQASSPGHLVPVARQLLDSLISWRTLGIGVSVPGFVDPQTRQVLFSSAFPGMRSISVAGLYEQAGSLPVALENDLHATAARWLLTENAARQDVLVVSIGDGRLGASVLIDGRPNRGCVTAANELGHTRLPVPTERCYCGQTGCLERIVSSAFLSRQMGRRRTTLATAVDRYDPAGGTDDPALEVIIDHLAMGLSNAVNFLRPTRLVLASPFVRNAPFAERLVGAVRGLMLNELVDRVRIDLWEEPPERSAESPAWLALAGLYMEGWSGD